MADYYCALAEFSSTISEALISDNSFVMEIDGDNALELFVGAGNQTPPSNSVPILAPIRPRLGPWSDPLWRSISDHTLQKVARVSKFDLPRVLDGV